MPSSRDLPALNKSFARIFLHNQFFSTPVYPSKEATLTSQRAIVTGGNTGLGLESARQLLALHLSHLIIAVRTPAKGETAAAELRKQYPKATIEVWTLDMASYESVQAFTRRVENDLQRLDIVILNAGLASNNFRIVASTGHEEIIQVNYLSTVLLATLLLPVLKAKRESNMEKMKEPPRMTIVNSGLALVAGFKNRKAQPLLVSFDDKKNFSPTDTYSTSKTLGHLWMWNAAEYISADDVSLSLVDPSYIKNTSLQRDQPLLLRPIIWFFSKTFGKSVPVGASTYIDAVVTKGREAHGSFLMNWEIAPFNDMLYTAEGQRIADRLWEETMRELAFADVEGILKGMKKGQ